MNTLVVTSGGPATVNPFVADFTELEQARLIPQGGKIYWGKGSFKGLLDATQSIIDATSYSGDRLNQLRYTGGNYLGTARHKPGMHDDECLLNDVNFAVLLNVLQEFDIRRIVITGGDGTLAFLKQLATRLAHYGIDCVMVYKTMDNDAPGNDVAVGFNSTAEASAEQITNMGIDAAALNRAVIAKIMGNKCGFLALQTAHLALDYFTGNEFAKGNVAAVLIPEAGPLDVAGLAARMEIFRPQEKCPIIIVSEGCNLNGRLAKDLTGNEVKAFFKATNLLSLEAEYTDIGYNVRSASPVKKDLQLAKKLARAAINAFVKGKTGVLCVRQDKIICVDFDQLSGHRQLDWQAPDILNLINNHIALGNEPADYWPMASRAKSSAELDGIRKGFGLSSCVLSTYNLAA